jgi:hypothetical protein
MLKQSPALLLLCLLCTTFTPITLFDRALLTETPIIQTTVLGSILEGALTAAFSLTNLFATAQISFIVDAEWTLFFCPIGHPALLYQNMMLQTEVKKTHSMLSHIDIQALWTTSDNNQMIYVLKFKEHCH